MKEIKISNIIPEQIIEETVYQCETCKNKHSIPKFISKCEICGSEICIDCKERIAIMDSQLDFQIYDEEIVCKDKDGDERDYLVFNVVYICSDCAKNKKFKQERYDAELERIVNKFNTECKKLNNKYLGGNK